LKAENAGQDKNERTENEESGNAGQEDNQKCRSGKCNIGECGTKVTL